MSAKADFNPFYVFIPIGIGAIWMGALIYMDSTEKTQTQQGSTYLGTGIGTGIGRDIHEQGQYQNGGKTRRRLAASKKRSRHRRRL